MSLSSLNSIAINPGDICNDGSSKDSDSEAIPFNKIERNFGSSAKTYKSNAQLQYDVGADLLSTLNPNLEDKLSILDLGCGPGLFTKELQKKSHVFVSLDLSKSMLESNKHQLESLKNGDADTAYSAKIQANSHALPFQPNSFDIVFSSLMVQWCDLTQVLQQVHNSLKKGGTAYISTLVKGSLKELEQAWSSVDSDVHIHSYLTSKEVKRSISSLPWSRIEVSEKQKTYWFGSAMALAKELKSLGANHVEHRKNKGLTSKSKWQAMEKAYSEMFLDERYDAIPASYQVMYLRLTK